MLEQFEIKYGEYLESLQEKANQYRDAYKVRDYAKIQDVRDGLAIGDIIIAPDFETEALVFYQYKENEYKECLSSREIEYRKKVGRNKNGENTYTYATQKEAENAAFLDCGDNRMEMIKAENNYRRVKELMKRKDQLYNTIASRLRSFEKN